MNLSFSSTNLLLTIFNLLSVQTIVFAFMNNCIPNQIGRIIYYFYIIIYKTYNFILAFIHSYTHILCSTRLYSSSGQILFSSSLESAIPKGKREGRRSERTPSGELLQHYYYLKFPAHDDDKKQILVGFIIILKFSTDNASIIACIHLLPQVPGISQALYKCLLTE